MEFYPIDFRAGRFLKLKNIYPGKIVKIKYSGGIDSFKSNQMFGNLAFMVEVEDFMAEKNLTVLEIQDVEKIATEEEYLDQLEKSDEEEWVEF